MKFPELCSRRTKAQKAYIQRTLDLIEKGTGVRSRGWTSPSVYPNADTFTATAAEGISYSLDAMDSDVLSRLATKSGPLVLIPYPVVTVDMGHYLERSKDPSDMERLWTDYVTELARDAADPDREASSIWRMRMGASRIMQDDRFQKPQETWHQL